MAPGEVFIVGYGNSLRGDDGVGQEVAEALRAPTDGAHLLADATIVQAHQLVPEMAFDISRSRLAVFLDAACDGRPAGSVALQWLRMRLGPERGPLHVGCWVDVTPRGVLTLALDLYGAAPPAALVTVGVASLEPGRGLSPLVRAAVPAPRPPPVPPWRQPGSDRGEARLMRRLPGSGGEHMHELSLVEELLAKCQTLSGGRTVAAVSVRCSPAVDPGELSEGFALLAGQLADEPGSDAGLSKAQLKLEMVPAYFHCGCGFDGELGPDDFAGHIGICPACGRVGEMDAGVELVAMSFADTEP